MDKPKIITWWSACGGEGKTTLAVSQAYQIAKANSEKVALLDFCEVIPSCYWALNMPFEDVMPIYDVIEKDSLEESILEKNMVECKLHNFKLFTGVNLERFELFQYKHFEEIIKALKSYSYIIIDTNAGIFFSGTLAALKNADKINIVVEPTYRSLNYTVNTVDFIEKRWGIPKDKFSIIANKMYPGGLDKDKIIKAFKGLEIRFVDYLDYIVECWNLGIPTEKGLDILLENAGLNKESTKDKKFLRLFG